MTTDALDLDALRALLDDGKCMCSSASTDWDGVRGLLDRLAAAEATIARCEALANEWEATTYKIPPGYPMRVNEFCRYWFKAPLRDALDQRPEPTP